MTEVKKRKIIFRDYQSQIVPDIYLYDVEFSGSGSGLFYGYLKQGRDPKDIVYVPYSSVLYMIRVDDENDKC